MMDRLKLSKGNTVYIGDKKYEVVNPISFDEVLLRDSETGKTGTYPRAHLRAAPESGGEQGGNSEPAEYMSERKWKIANERFQAIGPLLKPDRTSKEVEAVAERIGKCYGTIYNWIGRYEKSGRISSLAPRYDERGGKGKSRVDDAVQTIIDDTIAEFINQGKRLRQKKVHEEVATACRNAKVKTPHINTIANRIKKISKKTIMQLEQGKSAARSTHRQVKGSFIVTRPLAVIQIDESPLDIIIVDEVYRKPIGKPYINVAEDVFSRMVYGFYISLEHPSFFTIGQCLYMGIMPKEEFLKEVGVEGKWDIWGLPKALIIHTDNASWYRGDDLKRFCEDYQLEHDFRPIKIPEYGGHIERFIGTLNQAIHDLPGTTFSNPSERGEYDSEGKACMTFHELEQWITEFIVNKYHRKPHEGIKKMLPIKKYESGIFGDETTAGIGLPEIIQGEEAKHLEITLLPSVKRTIQKGGVVNECIHYQSDVLRPYEEREEPGKKRRKYVFKYDYRDISILKFYAPDLKQYFSVPYRNISFPPISIWELRKAQKELKGQNLMDYDEYDIFKTVERLRAIESDSAEKTKTARRQQEARRRHAKKTGTTAKAEKKKFEPLHQTAKDRPEEERRAVENKINDLFNKPPKRFNVEVMGNISDKEDKT